MKCPICGNELMIVKSRIILENDDTPDVETRIYNESDLGCRNKNCANYEKVVDTVKNEVQIV